MDDLRKRLRNRVQLTSDGHKPYLVAVREAFGADVDYAMLVKEYGNSDDGKQAHRRYSPGQVNGMEITVVTGSPDLDKVSTSYAERSNLTLRMSMRRFTRLTNAFSKKINNHALMVSLFCAYYNFCRPHKTLGKATTPAMAAGLTDRVSKLEDLIAIIDERTPPPAKPGPKPKGASNWTLPQVVEFLPLLPRHPAQPMLLRHRRHRIRLLRLQHEPHVVAILILGVAQHDIQRLLPVGERVFQPLERGLHEAGDQLGLVGD